MYYLKGNRVRPVQSVIQSYSHTYTTSLLISVGTYGRFTSPGMVRVMHLMHLLHLLHLMHLMHLVHLVRGVGINTQMHENMFFSSRRCPVAKRFYRMFHRSRQFDQCFPPPNVTVHTALRLAIMLQYKVPSWTGVCSRQPQGQTMGNS